VGSTTGSTKEHFEPPRVEACALCTRVILQYGSASSTLMHTPSAERDVYGNIDADAREFPYEQVADRLFWVKGFIESYLGHEQEKMQKKYSRDDENIADILNIVFVFMGARTGTLIMRKRGCLMLIERLNDIVAALGRPDCKLAWHECSAVNPLAVFVYRRDNPRYLRRYNLTQQEIGRNLDYFAAGHGGIDVTSEPVEGEEMGQIATYETTHGWDLYAERILLPYLRAEDELRMLQFQQRKIELLNVVSLRLGLSYRFAYAYVTPQIEQEIAAVLSRCTPPTTEWWSTHCYAVTSMTARFRYPLVLALPFYCGPVYTDLRWWSLIRIMYNTFATNMYWCHKRKGYTTALIEALIAAEETVFQGYDEEIVVEEVKTLLKVLEHRRETFPLRSPPKTRRQKAVSTLKNDLWWNWQRLKAATRSYFRPSCWKVKKSRVPPHSTIDAPKGGKHIHWRKTYPPMILLYMGGVFLGDVWGVCQMIGSKRQVENNDSEVGEIV